MLKNLGNLSAKNVPSCNFERKQGASTGMGDLDEKSLHGKLYRLAAYNEHILKNYRDVN